MVGDAEIRRLDRTTPIGRFLEIADLHAAEIHQGVLPLFGRDFLARLYSEMAAVPSAAVWAAIDGDRLVGFLAGSFAGRAMYREVLRAAWLPLMKLALPSLGVLLRRGSSLLRYSQRLDEAAPGGTPVEAELLAIAVDPNSHRGGIATKLVLAFDDALRERGIAAYRVTTNSAETASNAFYQARGFVLMGSMRHHALTLNVYEKAL